MNTEIANVSPSGADILENADALRLRMLHAVSVAIARLADEARGAQHIEHDGEMRACIALARLAPAMLRLAREMKTEADDHEFKLPPDLPEEEALRLLDELERANRPQPVEE